jgi:hypothetical protein
LPSIERPHAAAVDHWMPSPHAACATSYGTPGFFTSSTTTLPVPSSTVEVPALAPHLTIAHNQSESGHDPIFHDAPMRSVIYEVSTHEHSASDDPDLKAREREPLSIR